MNAPAQQSTPDCPLSVGSAAASVREVSTVSELGAIFEDDVNIVVLKNAFDAAVLADAEKALRQSDLSFRCDYVPGQGVAALSKKLKALPHLVGAISHLAELLAALMGAKRVEVRLDRAERATCPRFHADFVALRLVTTFVGSGTVYLDNADVDRGALGPVPPDSPQARTGMLRPGARIRQAAAGDVVLLKGERWPGHRGRGAVHRSPSARPQAPRLMLAIDRD